MLVLPAAAAEPEQSAGSFASLVHNGPSSGSAVIGRLENGTQVTVLDETRDYYKIDCYEMNGYIRKELLTQAGDGTYTVSCRSDSPDAAPMSYESMADTLLLRSSVLELARQQLGTPYVYGGSRPGGFDCSGLVYYVYGAQGIDLHRSADVQMQDGVIVPRDSLQVGDLVFFRAYGPWLASHVGIYVGDGQMIHAASGGIRYSGLDEAYYANSYVGARRLVNADTSAARELPSVAESPVLMARSTVGIRTAG